MRQRALQALLLVHAIEQTDLAGDAVSLDDRVQASREAADGRPLPAASNAPAQINGDTERFLVRRADALLARLRVRSPGVDRVLAAAAGATGLDRTILLLGFVLGVAIAFVDGGRIDIFAYPLIGLLLWNLLVYVILLVRAFRSSAQATRDPARWIFPALARQALCQPSACPHRRVHHSFDWFQCAAGAGSAALRRGLVRGRPAGVS